MFCPHIKVMDRLILPSRLHDITDRHSFFLIFYGFYAYTNTERLAPSLLRIASFASVKYQERMQLERRGREGGVRGHSWNIAAIFHSLVKANVHYIIYDVTSFHPKSVI